MTIDMPITDQYIIDCMRVPGHHRVFVLGCRAKRVTVLSQQYRAFNLIWALITAGVLREGDRVGVVGGGIGGLTVATAAMLKGLRVVLAEAASELIHLQRGNNTRLLHPNIYEWPNPGSEDERTYLPCLNWTADITTQVVAEIEEQWEEISSTFSPQIALRTQIRRIEPALSGEAVRIVADRWRSDPCNVIVVSVGFGIERRTSGLRLPSYWDNENLGQHTKGLAHPRRILISGLGDGGLIDVLRLKYKSFDHAKFAKAVARESGLDRYKEKLRDIDRFMPAVECSAYLLKEYEALNVPADLAYSFGEIRTDTEVVLNGPGISPLSPNASILHRLVVWSLIRANELAWLPGRIDPTKIQMQPNDEGIEHWVPMPEGNETAFDDVILRHGPAGCLTSMPQIDSAFKGIEESAAQDRTRTQLYPDGFYPTAFASKRPSASPSTLEIISGTVTSASVKPLLPTNAVPESPAFVRSVFSDASDSATQELMELPTIINLLQSELQAGNFLQAQSAAARVEELARRFDPVFSPELRLRTYRALYDFELQQMGQIKAFDGDYDLSRLRDLIQRLEHR